MCLLVYELKFVRLWKFKEAIFLFEMAIKGEPFINMIHDIQ